MNGVKVGETSARNGGGNPELSRAARPGKCRDLTAPAYVSARSIYGEEKVQTPNANADSDAAAKVVAGKKIPRGQPHAGSSPAPGTRSLYSCGSQRRVAETFEYEPHEFQSEPFC